MQLFKSKNKYYEYAKNYIICECRTCYCPNAKPKQKNYSFTYVNEGLNFMYFDVPKAASSTIRKNLFQSDNKYSLKIPKKNEAEYLKFSFVRNPWDRVISNWKMFTQYPFRKKQLESMVGRSDHILEDFLEVIEKKKNHHWLPQSLYVPENIDFIGRIEYFRNDIIHLLNQIKIQYIPLEWEVKNNSTSRNKDYRFYYGDNDLLINKVRSLYTEDIARFGYDYE